ncbi:calcium/sodium antiporter [Quadrisphaera sp. KR29]|uniref:calcium/sodium antiporter n=1 Tax=Quadrisphaera sp. KR29 TaxID=3461391 RepID=UPI004044478A
MVLDVGAVLLGLVLLAAGGEALVRGASRLGRAAGLSSAVVGLTVVSLCTGAPEVAVSLDAVLRGVPDLALGNAVGSNTVNVLLVLGLGALLAPIAVGRSVLRADLPVLLAASVLLLLACLDGVVSRLEGSGLLAGLVVYFAWCVWREKRSGGEGGHEEGRGGRPRGRAAAAAVLLVLVGVGALVLGADLLVGGGTGLARALGLSDLVIGLTVVAVGTATPEIVTVVVAGLRGEREMALGAVVGSCTVNIGAVVGSAAVVGAQGLPVDPQAVRFDVPVMLVATAVLVPLAWTGARVARTEGALLVVAFAGYLTYLLLSADDHAAAGTLGTALAWFAGPLAAAGLAVAVAREVRHRRAGAAVSP